MGIDVEFKDNFGEVERKIDSTSKSRMLEAVQNVRNKTIETLSGDRSGRVYTIPGTHRTYVASAPGEPPAVQLGDLRKSVRSGVKDEGKDIMGFVGTELPKGPMLEYGTKNMEARPWLRVSFEKSSHKVREIFTRVWF